MNWKRSSMETQTKLFFSQNGTGCHLIQTCCSSYLAIRTMIHHSRHLYPQLFWAHTKEANPPGSNTRAPEIKFSQERHFYLCQFQYTHLQITISSINLMQLEITQISKNGRPSMQNDCQAKERRGQLEWQPKSQCKSPLNYLRALHDTTRDGCWAGKKRAGK